MSRTGCGSVTSLAGPGAGGAVEAQRLACGPEPVVQVRSGALRGVRSGDVLLVKGSLGSRMGKIVEDMLNPAPQPRAANGW